jgi:preprotein translocase subunit YajC
MSSSFMFIIKVLVVLLVIAYFIRLRNLKRKRARKNTRKIKKEDKLYEK